jgi:hypothetical protein
MTWFAPRGHSRAFSLTEIAIAVGVVAVGLIAVLGLLPTGLNALRSGRDELAGAHCLRALCDGLRQAQREATDVPETFRAGGSLTNLTWTVGTPGPVGLTLTNLTSGGFPASRPEDTQLNARVELRPPAAPREAVTALVTVAWPATARWESAKWVNHLGQMETHVVFLPK